MKVLLIFSLCLVTVLAQFPPRINIPGAVQLPGNYRQARIQAISAQPQTIRVRRPSYARPSFKSVDPSPRPNFQLLEETAKPVTEEPEDDIQDINTGTPGLNYATATTQDPQDFFDFISSTTAQPRPQPTVNAIPFSPAPTPIKFEKFETPKPVQFRPQPTFIPAAQPQPIRNEPVRTAPARVQQLSHRPQKVQYRPDPRPYEEDDEPVQPVRQYTRPVEQKPIKHAPIKTVNKTKKPVAQVIRKYREDNPDGSITWGFENDDGSFKEEVIGVDCVTRGKYGYVDPDGLKREYTYETGIPCDKNQESDEEEKGYVDYQENKAVLPNGVTIDLNSLGKKKLKRASKSNH